MINVNSKTNRPEQTVQNQIAAPGEQSDLSLNWLPFH